MLCSLTCWTDAAQLGDSEAEQSVPRSRRPVSQERSPSERSSSAEAKNAACDARRPERRLNAFGSSSKAAWKPEYACAAAGDASEAMGEAPPSQGKYRVCMNPNVRPCVLRFDC